ncbi:hypothetical protein WDZ92_04775 [Nostoc sp. NIES-2111]
MSTLSVRRGREPKWKVERWKRHPQEAERAKAKFIETTAQFLRDKHPQFFVTLQCGGNEDIARFVARTLGNRLDRMIFGSRAAKDGIDDAQRTWYLIVPHSDTGELHWHIFLKVSACLRGKQFLKRPATEIASELNDYFRERVGSVEFTRGNFSLYFQPIVDDSFEAMTDYAFNEGDKQEQFGRSLFRPSYGTISGNSKPLDVGRLDRRKASLKTS